MITYNYKQKFITKHTSETSVQTTTTVSVLDHYKWNDKLLWHFDFEEIAKNTDENHGLLSSEGYAMKAKNDENIRIKYMSGTTTAKMPVFEEYGLMCPTSTSLHLDCTIVPKYTNPLTGKSVSTSNWVQYLYNTRGDKSYPSASNIGKFNIGLIFKFGLAVNHTGTSFYSRYYIKQYDSTASPTTHFYILKNTGKLKIDASGYNATSSKSYTAQYDEQLDAGRIGGFNGNEYANLYVISNYATKTITAWYDDYQNLYDPYIERDLISVTLGTDYIPWICFGTTVSGTSSYSRIFEYSSGDKEIFYLKSFTAFELEEDDNIKNLSIQEPVYISKVVNTTVTKVDTYYTTDTAILSSTSTLEPHTIRNSQYSNDNDTYNTIRTVKYSNDNDTYNTIRDNRSDYVYRYLTRYDLQYNYNTKINTERNIHYTLFDDIHYLLIREVQKSYKSSNPDIWYDNVYNTVRSVYKDYKIFRETLRITRIWDDYYTTTLRNVLKDTEFDRNTIRSVTNLISFKLPVYRISYDNNILSAQKIRSYILF